MLGFYFRCLNLKKTIESKLPIIIDAFVDYYGESERERIETKFKNSFIAIFQDPTDLFYILENIKSEFSKWIILRMKNEICLTDNEIEKLLGNGCFDECYEMNIYHYIDYKLKLSDESNIANEERERIFSILGYGKGDIDDLVIGGYFKRIDLIAETFSAYLKKYEILLNILKPHEEIYLNYIEKVRELEFYYAEKFICEFREYLPLLIIDEFSKRLDEINKECLKILSSNYTDTLSHITYFGSEYVEALKNGECDELLIEKERIEFFKNLGFNLGDDYEAYLNNPECKKFLPPQDIIDRMIERKNEYENEMFEKLYYTTNCYKKTKEEIDRLNLVSLNDGYNSFAFENITASLNPNSVVKNGKLVFFPILYFSSNLLEEFIDDTIIHEFNHLYTTEITNTDKKGITYTSGWDSITIDFQKDDIETGELDEYELFDEIINELIAQDITVLMHQKGNYIVNTPDNAKVRGGTSYERVRFLVMDFFSLFKDDIIKSRDVTSGICIEDVVGEENFDSLNKLVNEFDREFGNYDYQELLVKIESEIEDEDISKFKNFIKRRDAILEKMKTFKLMHAKKD